uniref:Uncharacterized protein n=1 Tax=Oryza sativa subsp. japonica TaxID=39947 RepID=Q6ESN4_ORYSJ|nr:hypothetical protein [Oryza sativa Japonica Group]
MRGARSRGPRRTGGSVNKFRPLPPPLRTHPISSSSSSPHSSHLFLFLLSSLPLIRLLPSPPHFSTSSGSTPSRLHPTSQAAAAGRPRRASRALTRRPGGDGGGLARSHAVAGWRGTARSGRWGCARCGRRGRARSGSALALLSFFIICD